MTNELDTRTARLQHEIDQALKHPPGEVRDAVVAALMDRLRAVERIKVDK